MEAINAYGMPLPVAVRRSGRRRHKLYQTHHTPACWLLSAGTNTSFIASQMGHENAKMVHEVYSKWIVGMSDVEQMIADKMPPLCPNHKR